MTSVMVIAVVFFVLYGLIVSTEKIMIQRQAYVVINERTVEHRSRL